jgi:hypothetical protein
MESNGAARESLDSDLEPSGFRFRCFCFESRIPEFETGIHWVWLSISML